MRYFTPVLLAAGVVVLSTAPAYADLGDQLFKLLPSDGAAEDRGNFREHALGEGDVGDRFGGVLGRSRCERRGKCYGDAVHDSPGTAFLDGGHGIEKGEKRQQQQRQAEEHHCVMVDDP